MLNEKMETALNKQLNAELYSAYLYLSMSAYFSSIKLPGFANWMRMQVQEELTHAMKFFDYLNSNGKVVLESISKPQLSWDSALAAFEHAYRHEQNVTNRINDLVELTIDVQDQETNEFLQWFVSEQVEEEESVNEVVQKLEDQGDKEEILLTVDHELAKREFTFMPKSMF